MFGHKYKLAMSLFQNSEFTEFTVGWVRINAQIKGPMLFRQRL